MTNEQTAREIAHKFFYGFECESGYHTSNCDRLTMVITNAFDRADRADRDATERAAKVADRSATQSALIARQPIFKGTTEQSMHLAVRLEAETIANAIRAAGEDE